MNTKQSPSNPLWALLVTGGTVIEYPPELYADEHRAVEEAERWGWVLSGAGWLEIHQPFAGRWQVGERDVRLVPLASPAEPSTAWWIGTFWDRYGTPDPEALLLRGREQALAWVLRPPADSESSVETQAMPWFVSATYLNHGEEEYAVAHLAKVVG